MTTNTYATFSIKNFVLTSILSKVKGVVGSKTDLEILKSVKIQLSQSILLCAATDTALSVIAKTTAIENVTDGALVIPEDKLGSISREVGPDATLTFCPQDDHHCLITTDNNECTWSIRMDNPDDYPVLPDPDVTEWQVLDRIEFSAALAAVSPAAAQDNLRLELMTVSVGATIMCATDTIRFHALEFVSPVEFLLPLSAVTTLQRFMRVAASPDIYVARVDEMLLFKVDEDTFLCALPQVTFPDTSRIFASVARNERTVTFPAADLKAAIARVRITADGDTKLMTIELGEESAISCVNKQGETARHMLLMTWNYPSTKISVNADHLLTALDAHSVPVITFALNEDVTSPIALGGTKGLTTIIRQLRSS